MKKKLWVLNTCRESRKMSSCKTAISSLQHLTACLDDEGTGGELKYF